ncbi:hypothetical protein GLAREA_12900 [Glarea lozoyensis ATCC 20868]|uniref:Uncharacterized protein n=1 Tax=Glarea lozoyensis (strain ATCC 20868 / MF5171) TaxID=1116229 RepID=S3CUU9_GLAL2|nr:uncharacterized protein GLAREA_12900 [Glarea lozoyensis ATCC 20868]EPE30177.1 hypothetical protein GLAREA_12900 [Glarea lozoyensis ATCC 20868]
MGPHDLTDEQLLQMLAAVLAQVHKETFWKFIDKNVSWEVVSIILGIDGIGTTTRRFDKVYEMLKARITFEESAKSKKRKAEMVEAEDGNMADGEEEEGARPTKRLRLDEDGKGTSKKLRSRLRATPRKRQNKMSLRARSQARR